MSGQPARDPCRPQDTLIWALQRARSRLAVAIAAETKRTPLPRRAQFLETDARLRCCLRRLGAADRVGGSLPPGRTSAAIHDLLRLSGGDGGRAGAQELCRQLADIADLLETDTDGAPPSA